jgi:hypothetical protein
MFFEHFIASVPASAATGWSESCRVGLLSHWSSAPFHGALSQAAYWFRFLKAVAGMPRAYSLKEVVASTDVQSTRSEAALFETGVPTHMGIDLSDPISHAALCGHERSAVRV